MSFWTLTVTGLEVNPVGRCRYWTVNVPSDAAVFGATSSRSIPGCERSPFWIVCLTTEAGLLTIQAMSLAATVSGTGSFDYVWFKDGAPVGHIQVTAAINGGNSGGPLFDECGRVAGIVVAKALTKLGTSKAFAEGVNLAIMVDELVPELEKAKLTYTVGTGACEAGSGSSVSMIQIATLFAAGASLFVALNKRAREALGRTTRKLTHRPEPPVLPAPPGRMVLVGVAGPFVGQRIPLSAKPCVLGRDASVSNLVFPHGSEQVSKRHCQVSCDKAGRILLEDSWSSNGTFAASGQRIAAGQPRELRPGDRFYVGSANNMFEVTAE